MMQHPVSKIADVGCGCLVVGGGGGGWRVFVRKEGCLQINAAW